MSDSSKDLPARLAKLEVHPATPCTAVRRIDVSVDRVANALELRYDIEGGVGRLVIPAQRKPLRADRLWQHTCCEAFLAEEDLALGYREFNFAPSTEWAIYQFSGYRDGMTVVDTEHAPGISVRREQNRLTLVARIDLEPLSAQQRDAGLRLALSTVIEEDDGRISYWALTHPAGKPDFHHPDGFVLTVPPAG